MRSLLVIAAAALALPLAATAGVPPAAISTQMTISNSPACQAARTAETKATQDANAALTAQQAAQARLDQAQALLNSPNITPAQYAKATQDVSLAEQDIAKAHADNQAAANRRTQAVQDAAANHCG